MVVVCHPEHPLAAQGTVTAKLLEGVDFIGFDRELSIRKEIDRFLRQQAVTIRVVMEFDNIETIKQAVEIGAGVSILPEPTIRREIKAGTLAAVHLTAPELQRPIGIIHLLRRVFTPTAGKFVELLRELSGAEEESGRMKAEGMKDES
jgi:DNA-binding transcriptional LysR family regulator